MTSTFEPFDDERRAIVLAASRAMAKHGFHQLSLERVAEEAGVPLADITRRFPSLKEILNDLVVMVMADMTGHAKAALEGVADGPEALTRLMTSITSFYLERIDLFRQIMMVRQIEGEERFGSVDERRLIVPLVGGMLDVVEKKLQEDSASQLLPGGIDPRRLAYGSLLTAIGIVTIRGLSLSAGVPLRHNEDDVVRDTCRALGATLASMRQLAALNAAATDLARLHTEAQLVEFVPNAVSTFLDSITATIHLRSRAEDVDATCASALSTGSVTQSGDRSLTAVPLRYESRIEGVLAVSGRALDTSELARLQTFATMIGISLENVRLYENLQGELDTRTKTLRETLVRLGESEKMAALGKLVAGVVHEMNSPAAAVVSGEATLSKAVGKLREGTKLEAQSERIVGIIEQSSANVGVGVRRLLEIVDQLKRFTRLDGADLERVDLVAGIKDAIALIERELGKQHVVVDETALPPVLCYVRRMHQVFVDVLRMLLQVGGHIVRVTCSTDGARVSITFVDASRIVPQEEVATIFVPTFTTKDGRIRAGYGLATAYLVMKDHGGEIRVESGDAGTRVTLDLPIDGPPT